MATDTDRLLLQLDADVTRLSKQLAKASGDTSKALGQMEKEADASMHRLEKTFGRAKVGEIEIAPKLNRAQVMELSHVAKSLFDQISAGASPVRALQVEGGRLAQVFQEGPGGVGGTFRALGGLLNPVTAGLLGAAGAAVVFAVAMGRGKAAAEWADELNKAAGKLGVTTEALQGYDFVALKAGLSTDQFRGAIEHGTTAFGAFLSNVGDAKVKQAFAALGITKDQARSFGDLSSALPTIADRIKGIGNAAEQAQIAKKLGLEELLPVLRRGGDALRDDVAEARRLGLVISDSVVKQGARAAEELRVASAVTSGNLTRAFIALAPIVGAVTDKVARLAEWIADAAEGFRDLQHQSQGYLVREAKRQQAGVDVDGKVAEFFGAKKQADGTYKGGALGFPGGLVDGLNARVAKISQMNKAAALDQLGEETREAGLRGDAHPLAEEKGVKAKKPKAGPADQTDDLDKAATDQAESAAKELATARAALVKDVMAHAEAEKKAVDVETTKKLADLSAEELKVRKSKNDAHRAQQLALLQAAKADTASAGEAKKEEIDRQAATAALGQWTELQDHINEALSRTADIRASLAGSTDERHALESANLRANQKRQLGDFDAQTTDLVANDPSQADGRARERAAMVQEQQAETAQLGRQQESPWAQWMEEGEKAGNDVGQVLQSMAVKSMTDLNTGIAEAVVNGRNMGDVFKSVFRQMEADVLSYLLRQAEVGVLGGGAGGGGLGGLASGLFGSKAPQATAASAGTSGGLLGSLISLLPHFAAGTDDAPGGLSLVGEKGPELVNLPGGAGVTPNNVLRGIGQLDPSKFAGGSTTVNHHVTVDVTGANGDEAIRQIAHEAATAGTLQAIAYSDRKMRTMQRAPGRDLTRY